MPPPGPDSATAKAIAARHQGMLSPTDAIAARADESTDESAGAPRS